MKKHKTKEVPPSTFTLYYNNTMSSWYKSDEKALNNIIQKNIKPTDI